MTRFPYRGGVRLRSPWAGEVAVLVCCSIAHGAYAFCFWCAVLTVCDSLGPESSSPMHRRHFLIIGGLSTLTFTAPSAWGASGAARDQQILARPVLLSVLGSPDRVRELGRCYRSMMPAEDDQATLLAALRSELGTGSSSSLRSRLATRIREDFAAGRTVTVRGWVLARTEAQQCALFSLV